MGPPRTPVYPFEKETLTFQRRLLAFYPIRGYNASFEFPHERLSLIVTTNLPFESWVDIFGCERLTGALLDRLTHRVHIIEANGPSYRLRQSKRRLQKGDAKNDEDDSPESQKTGSGDA